MVARLALLLPQLLEKETGRGEKWELLREWVTSKTREGEEREAAAKTQGRSQQRKVLNK